MPDGEITLSIRQRVGQFSDDLRGDPAQGFDSVVAEFVPSEQGDHQRRQDRIQVLPQTLSNPGHVA